MRKRRLIPATTLAFLLACTAMWWGSVAPTPAFAQTVADCGEYVDDGDWASAREACQIVLSELLQIRQSEAGEYCDNCPHSLAEAPTLLDDAEWALGYSRVAESMGRIAIHDGDWRMASYWLDQAVYNSSLLAKYNGYDALIRRLRPTAVALESRQNAELAAVGRHLPKTTPATAAPRTQQPAHKANLVSQSPRPLPSSTASATLEGAAPKEGRCSMDTYFAILPSGFTSCQVEAKTQAVLMCKTAALSSCEVMVPVAVSMMRGGPPPRPLSTSTSSTAIEQAAQREGVGTCRMGTYTAIMPTPFTHCAIDANTQAVTMCQDVANSCEPMIPAAIYYEPVSSAAGAPQTVAAPPIKVVDHSMTVEQRRDFVDVRVSFVNNAPSDATSVTFILNFYDGSGNLNSCRTATLTGDFAAGTEVSPRTNPVWSFYDNGRSIVRVDIQVQRAQFADGTNFALPLTDSEANCPPVN